RHGFRSPRRGANAQHLAQDRLDWSLAFFHQPHGPAEHRDFHFLVVQSHLMKNRSVQIAVIMTILDSFVTHLIRRAVAGPAPYSPAGEPDRIAPRVMIAPGRVLGPRAAAKFARPHYQRFVEHVAPLQVAE